MRTQYLSVVVAAGLTLFMAVSLLTVGQGTQTSAETPAVAAAHLNS